jgi:hypothetical protein
MTTFNLKGFEAGYLKRRLAEFAKGTPFEGAKLVATGRETKIEANDYEPAYKLYEYELVTVVNEYTEISGYFLAGMATTENSEDWIVSSTFLGDRKNIWNPEFISTLQPNRCDVCGVRHDRKNLYVVVKRTTGEVKVVGGACAKKFKGVNLVRAMSGILGAMARFASEVEEELLGQARAFHSLAEQVALAERIIREQKYVSRNPAETSGGPSTTERLSEATEYPKCACT